MASNASLTTYLVVCGSAVACATHAVWKATGAANTTVETPLVKKSNAATATSWGTGAARLSSRYASSTTLTPSPLTTPTAGATTDLAESVLTTPTVPDSAAPRPHVAVSIRLAATPRDVDSTCPDAVDPVDPAGAGGTSPSES